MKKKILFLIFVILLMTTIINADSFFTYIVKQGDSLSKIAQNYNVSINDIISINNLNNPDMIMVNQEIKIPGEKKTYIVRRGDNLCKIAEKYSVSITKLIEVNDLKTPDKIYIGQKLTIPNDQKNDRTLLASRSQGSNYIWPVHGKISSEYGWRIHPIKKERLFHTGLDIAVPYGTPIYAAESGIVQYSGWSEGYGNLIIIRHRDNSLTYYAHSLQLLVEKGQTIRQGKVIALSGSSGLSTGPHLHFEIRINGRHANPLRYLNRQYMNNNFRI
ncbi:MAG: peptidoglycan DD-metalloendopeptidase family protein [bacterium]